MGSNSTILFITNWIEVKCNLICQQNNENNLVVDDLDFTASFDGLRWIVKWKWMEVVLCLIGIKIIKS